jgi:hypothetical protein
MRLLQSRARRRKPKPTSLLPQLVGALASGVFGGLDLLAALAGQETYESPHRVPLPAGRFHDPASHPSRASSSRLPRLSCCCAIRLLRFAHARAGKAWWGTSSTGSSPSQQGSPVTQRPGTDAGPLPDSRDCSLAVRELLNRLQIVEGSDACEAVPGFDGPFRCKFSQLPRAGERL